jgi:hypothetical protein
MGHQQRIPFVVELEWTARAIEAHIAQGIANLVAIFAASLLIARSAIVIVSRLRHDRHWAICRILF